MIGDTDGGWYLQNNAGGSYETSIKAVGNGAVYLDYDNSPKLVTNASGIIIGGDVANATDTQGVALQTNGQVRFRVADTSTEALIIGIENSGASKIILNGAGNGYFAGGVDLPDSAKIQVGTGDDLEIYHTADTASYIAEDNLLIIRGDGLQLQRPNGNMYVKCIAGNAVDLYHNNQRKFSTDADGIGIHAEEGGEAIIYLTADEGDDNADKWLTKATNGGGYHIQNKASGSWENNIVCATEDAVSLYYDNSEKLRTYSQGVKVYTPWDGNPALNVRIQNADSGSAATVIEFITDHYGGSRGNIGVTLTGTSYNTSSDYRLKENITSLTGAITRIKNLSPKRFNFKEDTNKTIDGFLAHEVSSVVPEAVTGKKDGSKMQQLDYSKLTTLTIAALQEALAKIETLETKVAALESS